MLPRGLLAFATNEPTLCSYTLRPPLPLAFFTIFYCIIILRVRCCFNVSVVSLIAGKRCLEIGCGPGLVASCLCRVGAQELLLTDGDPQTLVNCLSNLGLNGHTHAELLGSWQEAVKPEQLPGPTGVAAASSKTQVDVWRCSYTPAACALVCTVGFMLNMF